MAWSDLNTIYNPSSGTSPPATWGDAIRDNFQFLAGMASAEVLTSQTTSSTSYADLATTGPAVTVTTGTKALVIITAQMSNSTAGAQGIMSHAVSGATTVAASDNWLALATSNAANESYTVVGVAYHTTLTAGSNTFTAKYKTGGSGTMTALRRKIFVIPLPA